MESQRETEEEEEEAADQKTQAKNKTEIRNNEMMEEEEEQTAKIHTLIKLMEQQADVSIKTHIDDNGFQCVDSHFTMMMM